MAVAFSCLPSIITSLPPYTNHSTMSRDMKDWGDYEDDEELPQSVEVRFVFVACGERKGGRERGGGASMTMKRCAAACLS